MKDLLNYYYLLILSFCFFVTSCSKNLEYSYDDTVTSEIINGFVVKWSNRVTNDKQDVLRSIINNMVFVEGGTFTMGVNQIYDPNARSNEAPAHVVKLSDYYICSHELTAEQIACLTNNPEHVFPSLNSVHFGYYDWELFVELLGNYTGLVFDFPTEAQWEYAARGGILTKGNLYPGSNKWEEVWSDVTDGTSIGMPNELGLYNMADGRAEWCKDLYAEYGTSTLSLNPCNLFGKYRVVRGGCYKSNSTYKNWFSKYSIDTPFSSLENDYRLCRSTSRTYGYLHSDSDITWRPVINVKNHEK